MVFTGLIIFVAMIIMILIKFLFQSRSANILYTAALTL